MRDQTSTPWGNLRIRLLPIDSERICPEKQKMSPQARSLTRSDLTASRALNSPELDPNFRTNPSGRRDGSNVPGQSSYFLAIVGLSSG